MKRLTNRLSEMQQILLTHLVNRTFRNDPGFVDRLALRILESTMGKAETEDPELEHTP